MVNRTVWRVIQGAHLDTNLKYNHEKFDRGQTTNSWFDDQQIITYEGRETIGSEGHNNILP